ncbi:Ni(II)/Co(II) efflux transporter accessory subunit RcnB, partial [Salmonella enterica]|nr:Ni(II)/Co(II) efflux transporter accessory subunit RcnB [Salmonella enterica]MBK0223940.1 Ni(II)/Co(II) efflux transporter accessory subunit RcnB [Salmonella enterica subsp. enterica serovar Infantis]
YNIKQWKLRNLPAPDAGTHWTYMGGAYVLINDTDGKIIKAYDGEIFYHR